MAAATTHMATVASSTCVTPLCKGKGEGVGQGNDDDNTASDTTDTDVSETPSALSTGEAAGAITAYTRRLRQTDSDWEAYDDSDTDSYLSVF